MRDYNFMPGFVMKKRICGVMVSMISTILVDCAFEPCSGQTNDYEIDICCFSAKHAVLRSMSRYLFGSESG